MNSEPSQQYNDEIDLADLVRSLWNGKWLVMGTTLATVILAMVYLITVPKSYTGTLYIAPLSIVEANKYLTLGETELVNVNSNQLESLFIEDLQLFEGFKKFTEENKYIERLENESNLEFTARKESVVRGLFIISKPVNKKDDIEPKWTIELTTQQPELATEVLSNALSFSNDRVNSQIQNAFDTEMTMRARNIAMEIEDISIAADILLSQEKLTTQVRIAFLKEQAIIARAVGIEQNTLTAQVFTTQSALVTNVNQEQPFYLRGYVPIEKEIDILSSRQAPELFIPELASLEKAKQELLLDQSVNRAKIAIKSTPIGTDTFKAASYDLSAIEFKTKTKTTLVLALSLVLGGMLGIFVLLIRNAVTREKQP
jgi:chain length determinant protein (polysaccharide antigen chain regulator)